MTTCPICGSPLESGTPKAAGRPAKYCSGTCRQKAYRRRVNARHGGQGRLDVFESLDSFIGRNGEIREIEGLLATTRLITLVGPAGVGKSRIVAELAGRSLLRKLTSDLHWLALDGPGHTVERQLADGLGVTWRPEAGPEPLVRAIGDDRLLVVLDAFDRVRPACAAMVRVLLERCPGARFLATGREPLGLAPEVPVPVRPLDVPGEAADEAEQTDAVRLFVARASASNPAFELTPETTPVVAEICRRLDGLPLALELAAGRSVTLPPGAILAELDNPLALLVNGPRTVPERHRDLRSAVEWSHRLLSPEQKTVFRRLSVFAGGFDAAAVNAVCAHGGNAWSLVRALERKSLVHRDSGRRFRLLGPIRAYAYEQLVSSGEKDAVMAGMARWLSGLARPVLRKVHLAERTHQVLSRERENLRVAVEHAEATRSGQFLPLAIALAMTWRYRGEHRAALSLLEHGAGAEPGSAYRGLALAEAALSAGRSGDLRTGLQLAREAVECERGEDRPVSLAKSLTALSFLYLQRGEHEQSVAAQRECLEVVRTTGDAVDLAIAKQNLAWKLLLMGRSEETEALLEDVFSTAEAMATRWFRAATHHTAGVLWLRRGLVARAATAFVTGFDLSCWRDASYPEHLEGLALVAVARAQDDVALVLGTAVAHYRTQHRVVGDASWTDWVEAAVARAATRLGPAQVSAARATGCRLTDDNLRGRVREWFGDRDAVHTDLGHGLTHRELAIADLVAQGLTNAEIARRLALSDRVVGAGLATIRAKLALRSRTEVGVWSASRRPARPG